MPRPHPKESREDVVAIARRGEAPAKQIATEFGISESCLPPTLAIAATPRVIFVWRVASILPEFRGKPPLGVVRP